MDIDPEQLQKVQDFRKKYKDIGIYGTFTDTVNFENTLQIHLFRLALSLRRGGGEVDTTHLSNPTVTADEADSEEPPSGPLLTQESNDDPGFLDLIEEGINEFNEGTKVLNRLEKHIRELGEKMDRGTEDLTALADESGNMNPSRPRGSSTL